MYVYNCLRVIQQFVKHMYQGLDTVAIRTRITGECRTFLWSVYIRHVCTQALTAIMGTFMSRQHRCRPARQLRVPSSSTGHPLRAVVQPTRGLRRPRGQCLGTCRCRHVMTSSRRWPTTCAKATSTKRSVQTRVVP